MSGNTVMNIQEGLEGRDRLIRVEERLKHMDETMGRALRDLKDAISELANGSKVELLKTQSRLTALEQRVDKIYWLWGAAVMIGTPAMMVITKFVFAKFGL